MTKPDLKKGLTTEEAIKSQNLHGENKLSEKKQKSIFLIYLEQFKDLMVLLLIGATIVSLSMAIYHGVTDNWNWTKDNRSLIISFIEPFIILFVITTNALVGTIQEIKSQKAVAALKNMSPQMSKVLRDGKLQIIKSEDIVIGDILFIESGDIVGADGVLIESHNLECIESSLTGESLPTSKNANVAVDYNLALADQKFKVFSSTSVSSGNAWVQVTEIGDNTEIGKITQLINNEQVNPTPLQMKINKLGKLFGYAGIILFVLSIIAQIIFQAIDGSSFVSASFWAISLINAISLAVAAIPEGLVAFTTIILSLNVKMMAKEKAIVKSLMAVETLGSTAIICSDKTGTLTENKMTLVNAYANKNYLQKTSNVEEFKQLLTLSSLCTEANIFMENGQLKEVGDPTELALLHAVEKYFGKHQSKIKETYPRIKTIPFDSDRKLMSSINIIDNKHFLITKGAPESINNILANECMDIETVNEGWANCGYRVLAISVRELTTFEIANLNNLNLLDLEKNMNFVGMIALIDPPRESSKKSIELCKQAGIKPIMITGDNIITATSIAKELGIYNEGDLSITGVELDKMSDEQLFENIEKYSVYARVAPKDKIRIVKMWQMKDQVVAMTGDGVNDAPALKASDIGCAMGITGTEVSKQAADLILVDDNFSTVVKAVDNGRKVYQKIRNVIQNLLITSIAEIVLVFFGLLIFRAVFNTTIKNILLSDERFSFFILSATQLLWINLFTHGFPAIALGIQENKESYMNIRPHSKYESIFARGMGWNTLWQGVFIGLLSLVGYYVGAKYALNPANNIDPKNFVKVGSTIAFLIIGIGATFNSLNLMTTKSIFISNPIFYWKVYASVIFSIICLLVVVFIKPIASVFSIYTNFVDDPKLVAIAFGLTAIIIPVFTIHKLISNLIKKQKNKYQKIEKFELIKKPKSFFKNK
ncbi:cation-translocating P-type ATPase [Mycoplasma phocoenae]|uniref:Cation-translocating P-type ATPase n=1 Tax=Mycoplasma phocoenae TaxID=754517 RepID=A0A858U698_9MOLU|nr:cation-translocating P-type ATPase [Mycoplasma phocoenae]QJG66753.1 cation-translocating P-type ATPase [Mycoplasma phocoenae]